MYLCDYILKIQEYFGSNHLVLFEIKAKGVGVSLLDISGVLDLCIRIFFFISETIGKITNSTFPNKISV